jgi:NitT/TauT family transport system substrate-binding protein
VKVASVWYKAGTIEAEQLQQSRRAVLTGLLAFGSLGLPFRSVAANRLDALTIHGMPSVPSVVLARLVQAGSLSAVVGKPALAIYRNVDLMRVAVINGTTKMFAAPSYSTANMFNRGVRLRQINILTWGLVYVLSRTQDIGRIEDLAGRHLLVPLRNDAPDLILRLVLLRSGMRPDKDVRIQYVGAATEAVQLFLAGRADCVLLPEPFTTAAEIRAETGGVTAHRVIDLTEAYAQATGRPARIAQAGLAVTEDFVQAHPEVVAAVQAGCLSAAQWTLAHPAEAGRLISDALNLTPEIVTRSIPRFRLAVQSAADARPDMEHYFADLMEMSPDIVGGRLPEARYYWGAGG